MELDNLVESLCIEIKKSYDRHINDLLEENTLHIKDLKRLSDDNSKLKRSIKELNVRLRNKDSRISKLSEKNKQLLASIKDLKCKDKKFSQYQKDATLYLSIPENERKVMLDIFLEFKREWNLNMSTSKVLTRKAIKTHLSTYNFDDIQDSDLEYEAQDKDSSYDYLDVDDIGEDF